MTESDIKYVPYKELVKKRALEYYYANKETIYQKKKGKYNLLRPEEKKRLQENNRQWYNNQTPEKQQEMRMKVRKYNKNRYDNMMAAVREEP